MREPKILMVFNSEEGQTAKVADRVADVLRGLGATVDSYLAENAPPPAGYDAVVVGDPIHMGHHSPVTIGYLKDHRQAIAELPSAMFQLSLTSAHHDPVHDAAAWTYVEEFEAETGFGPDVVGVFAGALAYRQYGWIKRRVMKRIAEEEGADTDTSRNWEYTDWEAVDHFAHDVHDLVVRRLQAAHGDEA
jgi:menaquinone-dependent protoporphyrinogen oxidase